MFDQMMESFRKATESTLQVQQEMFRNLTTQWSQTPGMMMPGGAVGTSAGWMEQVRAFQKAWSHQMTDLMTRHREALDTQYRAGIRTIEDAFRMGEARDPEQYRRLTEQLWRQSFDALRSVSESQVRDFQAAAEKWFESATKATPASKV
jgi:hypothetical protein